MDKINQGYRQLFERVGENARRAELALFKARRRQPQIRRQENRASVLARLSDTELQRKNTDSTYLFDIVLKYIRGNELGEKAEGELRSLFSAPYGGSLFPRATDLPHVISPRHIKVGRYIEDPVYQRLEGLYETLLNGSRSIESDPALQLAREVYPLMELIEKRGMNKDTYDSLMDRTHPVLQKVQRYAEAVLDR